MQARSGADRCTEKTHVCREPSSCQLLEGAEGAIHGVSDGGGRSGVLGGGLYGDYGGGAGRVPSRSLGRF
jgi:hypothetical protein